MKKAKMYIYVYVCIYEASIRKGFATFLGA